MRTPLAAVALMAALASPGTIQAAPDTYVCTTSEKHICNMGTGCVAGIPGSWANIDIGSGTYERCDGRAPCDRYQATFTMSGQTLNIEIPGKAAFLKMLPGGGFSEVASQGTVAVISYGYFRQIYK